MADASLTTHTHHLLPAEDSDAMDVGAECLLGWASR
jgi:hypothetical protein